MKSKKSKLVLGIGAGLLAVIVALSSVGVFVSYKLLTVTNSRVVNHKLSEDTRIVLLSDLHDSSFGKGNGRLIEKVRKLEPDVIFTVGDMVNSDTVDFSSFEALYRGLCEIAPVYSALGNHELDNPYLEKIEEILKEHTTFLHNEYIEVNLNGNNVRLGSLAAYHPDLDNLNEYLRDFADTDKFTILLSHCPEYYFWGVDEVGVDLMLSGHTHGGQVIIPFKGGLYAPEQGYFPKYDYGVFYEEMATLVVSRGLGSSSQAVPRFNNPPEILCLTLTEVQK